MSELFEKSMATLELPQVLALLADCAATLEGKERCLALRPLTDLDDVARAQEETSAAVKMLILRGSPGFSGVKPVSASLQRATWGEPVYPGAAGHRLCAAVRPGGAGLRGQRGEDRHLPPVPLPDPKPLPGGQHHQLHPQ